MYDPTQPFSPEEINLIENAGLTLAELINFYSRFPDQDLVTAIGGAVMEKQHTDAGLTATLEADTTIYPDAPKPPERGVEASEVAEEPTVEPIEEAPEDSKLPAEEVKAE